MTRQAINNYNLLVNQSADKILVWLGLVDSSITAELAEFLHCRNTAMEVARILSSGICPPRL